MLAQVRIAAIALVLLSLLTGVAYPLVVTGISRVAFSSQAEGSLLVKKGHTVGSRLIGEPFADPKYLWSRPSATSPSPYNASSSTGSNLGPSNPALRDAVKARVEALRAADPGNDALVPIDLVTASGSGLDPHESPAAAKYQARRIARARGMDVARVIAVIDAHTEAPTLGFLGEPRVNVLETNLALDAVE